MSQSAQGGAGGAPSGTGGKGGASQGNFTSGGMTQMRNAENVFGRAAGGVRAGMDATTQGLNYSPMMVNGGGYQASTIDPNSANYRYNAAQVNAPGRGLYDYEPLQVDEERYAASQLAGRDLDPYMNPYEDQVVDQSLSDIERARQMAANQTGAQATAMGAFGGSRQALMQTENNRNYLDQSARTAGQLRQQGFQNAQNMALQDIGAQNQASQFNLSNDMQAQLANQQANAQRDQFVGGLAGRQAMQAQLANQQSQNQASQFGARSGLQAQMANQAAQNNASRFGLQQNMQAQLANQNQISDAARLRLASANQLGNLSNLGFGMGQQAQQMMAGQGQYRRGIEQQLIDSGRQQFGAYGQAPQNSLSMLAQAIGGVPYGQTQSRDPGLFDYLTLGATAASGTNFSDRRLKTAIRKVGMIGDIAVYVWEWLRGSERHLPNYGVIAQEVREIRPDCVIEGPDGFLKVDYGRLFA